MGDDDFASFVALAASACASVAAGAGAGQNDDCLVLLPAAAAVRRAPELSDAAVSLPSLDAPTAGGCTRRLQAAAAAFESPPAAALAEVAIALELGPTSEKSKPGAPRFAPPSRLVLLLLHRHRPHHDYLLVLVLVLLVYVVGSAYLVLDSADTSLFPALQRPLSLSLALALALSPLLPSPSPF
eukprot:385405-Hanusia_phi.AAC.1